VYILYTHLRCAYAEENESLPGPREWRENDRGQSGGQGMQKGPREWQEREEEARDERKRKVGGKTAETRRFGPRRGEARGYSETGRRLSIQHEDTTC